MQQFRHRLNDTTHQIVLGIFLACLFVAVVEGVQWTNGWRTNITTADGVTHVRINHQRDRLKAKMKGDITWTEDEGGVESLGPGAFFEIEERSAGQRRRLEVTRRTNGEPHFAWFVNRKAVSFDESGREWLRQTLPQIHRRTGFDAEGRVARILTRGGVEAVLQEITMIPGDHVQGTYFQRLIEQATPEGPEWVQILELAGQEIRSDFEQAKVLELLPYNRLGQEEIQDSFLEVAETIGSDFELRRALSTLVEEQVLEPAQSTTLLKAGLGIGSDFEMASFLVVLAEAHTREAPLPELFAEALRTVSSDFEQRRVASAVLEHHREAPTIDLLLSVAEGIGNDHEQAEFLSEVADHYPYEMSLPPSFFSTLETVDSDFEHRRVLTAVLDRRELGQDTLGFVLRSASNIRSDFELAEMLLHLLDRHQVSDELRPLFEEVLENISSDFEHQRVLAEFVESPEPV